MIRTYKTEDTDAPVSEAVARATTFPRDLKVRTWRAGFMVRYNRNHTTHQCLAAVPIRQRDISLVAVQRFESERHTIY